MNNLTDSNYYDENFNNDNDIVYWEKKYLKYKKKYLILKNIIGSGPSPAEKKIARDAKKKLASEEKKRIREEKNALNKKLGEEKKSCKCC